MKRRVPIRRHYGYKPPKKDSRLNEARVFVQTARDPSRLTARGIACTFNLKEQTAVDLLADLLKEAANGLRG